ncbi:M1 family aminopeptidase [Deltaproteobacteria bacterium TL4]
MSLSIPLLMFSTTSGAAPQDASSLPHYQIEVQFQQEKQRLVGEIRVTFASANYPGDMLLFALPMNRFMAPDKRGARKDLQTPIFAIDVLEHIVDDPMYPYGFNGGNIIIQAVRNTKNQPLKYSIGDNPALPLGYSPKRGLLKIFLSKPIFNNTIVIKFKTTFPRRFEEGLVRNDLVTVLWHPVLLPYKKGQWVKDLLEPAPGTYEVQWSATTDGTLITTSDHVLQGKAHQKYTLPAINYPVKYFPLIFSPNYEYFNDASHAVESYYYKSGNERLALKMQQWSLEFLQFVKEQYGLDSPWKTVRIVAIQGNQEQINVVNNLVLVTTPHYKRSAFLDRRVLGFFIRGMAQLWFGERVWNNLDTQLWLNMGIPAFFSLKFFDYKFGHDGRIFDFMDWLNPHYREHFFESMVRDIRPVSDLPIITSLNALHEVRIYLKVVTYKTGLVLSMLEYLIGKENFKLGLAHFLETSQYQVATIETLQKSMEQFHPDSLQWFIAQWFYSTKLLDYAIKEVSYQSLPEDLYEVRIIVKKNEKGQMPIQVVLITDDGTQHRKMARGNQEYELLEFITRSPPDVVSLDPDEELLETSRQNNHTFYFYRVRFAFDWKKNREILVTLVPQGYSNAIDGNLFGIKASHRWDNYTIAVTPGYGTKSDQLVYIATMERRNLIRNGFTVSFGFSRLAGMESRGISSGYSSPLHQEELSYNFTASLAQERAFETRNTNSQENGISETGDVSNLSLEHQGSVGFYNLYFLSWSLRMEQPQTDFGSDFSYTLWMSRMEHILKIGFRQQIEWEWIYNTTQGTTPLQKKHQLGDPKVLRGYPQRTLLRDDTVLASRVDYRFPLVASYWWGDVTSLGVRGSFFYDQGKAWSINQSPGEVPLRQNVGIGIEWNVNALTLVETPFKIQVAYPINDPDFDKPQFILFEALSFF